MLLPTSADTTSETFEPPPPPHLFLSQIKTKRRTFRDGHYDDDMEIEPQLKYKGTADYKSVSICLCVLVAGLSHLLCVCIHASFLSFSWRLGDPQTSGWEQRPGGRLQGQGDTCTQAVCLG